MSILRWIELLRGGISINLIREIRNELIGEKRKRRKGEKNIGDRRKDESVRSRVVSETTTRSASFIRLIASFVRMSRSKWNREKFFPFFSIHFERFTLSLIVQLTSINRAENEKFGEIWLISQNTRIPSLEWYNFSFSLFFFLKKSVNRMCARKKLEIESYERQESATVQAKKAVNLNAFFFFILFLVTNNSGFRTRQDSLFANAHLSRNPWNPSFRVSPSNPRKKKQKLQCLLVIGLGLARWHLRVIRLQSSYIFIYVLYKANRVTNK